VGKVKHLSVHDALQHVAEHPPKSFEPTVDAPVWELIGQVLFVHANSGDPRVRGSMGRATAAQKMIFDRISGRRRPGTHPAQVENEEIEFLDLTIAALQHDPDPDDVPV
jgi:hypothetical protein